MPNQDQPETPAAEQSAGIQRLVALSEQRTELAEQRTAMAEKRTRLAEEQLRMLADRSKLADQRSEMSAERTYLSAERTLSVWVRTASALMIFGLAIDRFGMLFQGMAGVEPGVRAHAAANALSTLGGAALVAFGVLMAVTSALRFVAYARVYRSSREIPYRHGPFLAPLFALLVAIFGTVLLIFLLALAA